MPDTPTLSWVTVVAELHMIFHGKEEWADGIEIRIQLIVLTVRTFPHPLRRLGLEWLQLQMDETRARQAELSHHQANLFREVIKSIEYCKNWVLQFEVSAVGHSRTASRRHCCSRAGMIE